MGEVYKARDTRLDRVVAVKVSKEQFSERFEHEARAVAALNHPHICTLHDVGPNYLVMEYVEGTPLQGPLQIEKAIAYANQILDALDAAHRKGIIHRDLKPDNILVTKQGIKLLDFGLAKQTNPLTESDATRALTSQGQIAGTLQYMSPEQLQGKEIDTRSDLFAFGCVLYEMLTGKRAFEGQNAASVVAAILEREPAPLTAAPPLDRVVRRALAKDPDQRFQTARDLKAALAWAMEQPSPSPLSGAKRHFVPWAVAGVLAIALAAVSWMAGRASSPKDRPLVRLNVDLGPEAMVNERGTPAISPDGRRIVFAAKTGLATRLLDQDAITVLPGTANGFDPFFAPDGEWVGFFADGKMKKISVRGGAALALCDAPFPRGASWGEDGSIIVALDNQSGLWRVSAAGGTPRVLTKPWEREQATHRWPQILPGGNAVVFTGNTSGIGWDHANIELLSLKTGEIRTLLRGGFFPRYLPTGGASNGSSGHLVYVHKGTLFGVPFALAEFTVRGTPVPLLEDVAANANSGSGKFGVGQVASGSTTLIYVSGKSSSAGWPVVWLASSGETQPLLAKAGVYFAPRFSPDGGLLAITGETDNGLDLFIYDLRHDTMSRLTFTGQANGPVWTPDGKHLVFSGGGIWWLRADGAGKPQRLLDTKGISANFFTPDGRRLVYRRNNPEAGSDLCSLPLDLSDPEHPKPGTPESFLQTSAIVTTPTLSPDGRWIAYGSNESGRNEVYVRPFRISASGSTDGKWQISTGGGSYPVWSHAGRNLFYANDDNRIMVTEYSAQGDSFSYAKPRLWSDKRYFGSGGRSFDLAPDGKRFAIFPRADSNAETQGNVHVTLLLNFFDEVRRRVPVNNR
jgi:serine/threonine-protein kinase